MAASRPERRIDGLGMISFGGRRGPCTRRRLGELKDSGEGEGPREWTWAAMRGR